MQQQNISPESMTSPVDKTVAALPAAGAVPLTTAERTTAAAAEAVGIATHRSQKNDTAPTPKMIGALQGVQSVGVIAFTAELVGGILGFLTAKPLQKFGATKAATVARAVLSAPIEALRETRLNQIHLLPANYLRAVGRHAESAGGTAAEKWAPRATSLADSISKKGTKVHETIGGHIRAFGSRAESATGGWLAGAEPLAAASGPEKLVDRLFSKLHARAVRKFDTHHSKALDALHQEAPDMIQSIKHFFTRGEPARVGMPTQFSDVAVHLNRAGNASNAAERLGHMEAAAEALDRVKHTATTMKSGAAAKEAETLLARVGHVESALQKTGFAAQSAHSFEMASGQGVKGLLKAAGAGLGRMPLFAALVSVGAAAGVGAIMLTHRHGQQQAHRAVDEMTAIVGDPDNAYLRAAKDAHAHAGGRRLLHTSVAAVGEAANGAVISFPHGGGAGLLMASMLPMVNDPLKPPQTAVQAFHAWREVERGERSFAGGEGNPEKQQIIADMLAVVPAIAAHGGRYNRLVGPLVRAIDSRSLTSAQTLRLLSDDKAFTEFTQQVEASQHAAQTPATNAAAAAAEAAEATKAAPKTPAAAQADAADAQIPSTRLTLAGANTLEHQGRLETQQRQRV